VAIGVDTNVAALGKYTRGERLLAPTRQVLDTQLRLVPMPSVRLGRLGSETALQGAIAPARGAINAAVAPA